MPSFQELQQHLSNLQHRKAVLLMLVEHIDAEFRTIGGAAPKKAIKTDQGTLVPESVLEATSADLAEEIRTIDQDIAAILSTPLETPAQTAAPAQ